MKLPTPILLKLSQKSFDIASKRSEEKKNQMLCILEDYKKK